MLDWQAYIKVAHRYQKKAKFEDREDTRHDIITRLAEVASRTPDQHLTELAMYRVASYVVMEYWHNLKRQPTLLSLNEEITDAEGDSTELYQTLADDKAINLDDWIDCKTWLKGCPGRLVKIAIKKVAGKPLNHKDQVYLNRYRKKNLAKLQKSLF